MLSGLLDRLDVRLHEREALTRIIDLVELYREVRQSNGREI
jgi:hypothetical protein